MARGIAIDFAIEGDDAAKGRGGVGAESLGIGVGCFGSNRHAAGVGVLDDDAGWGFKTFYTFPSGIGVGNIVVAELLALQLLRGHQRARGRVQVTEKRGVLVRVFAVAQILQFHKAAIGLTGKHRHAAIGLHRRQVVADRAVVLANAVEGSNRQGKLGAAAHRAMGLQFGYHGVVLAGVGEHGHVFPVFGRAAYHGRAADVDVFNRLFQRASGARHRGFEGIQIHHQQIDGLNAMGCERLHVRQHIAPREQAAMNFRM